jgi:hypothetical protein
MSHGSTVAMTVAAPAPSTDGPLSAVLEAFRSGAHSLAEVGARSGLSPEMVRAAVEHLVRVGRLEAKELAVGCPTGGCGSCASGTPQGTAGCGAPRPSGRRSGPVLITIGLRRT